jgi:hypothetical protein
MPAEVEQINPALTKLSDVVETIAIPDMNYMFCYTRVKKPDDTQSDLFVLHYKENQQENWATSRGLLSQKFTVAKTAEIIRQIQENLAGNIQNERHFRSETSVKSSFTLAGYQIDVDDEPDVDKILFKLVTNVQADLDVLCSANLSFNVINGFSGNHALQLNYGILKTLICETVEDQVLPINNVFILDKFTKRLIHDNHLAISIQDVTDVQQNITRQIELFKSLNITQELVNEFSNKFPKKFTKKFLSLFENLPENLRNFYYCSYLWSVLVDSERKIDLEIKLRSYIAEKVQKAITELEVP